MEKLRITELIKIDSLGCINSKDSAELLKHMQDNKEFPWKLMGDFQNLTALFAVMAEPEIPSKKVKEKLFASIESKAKKELIIDDDSIKINSVADIKTQIINTEENVEVKPEKTLTFKEPDHTALDIFTHKNDFEEVKPRVSRIKHQAIESPVVEKKYKTEKIVQPVENKIVERSHPIEHRPKVKRRSNKILAVASVLFIIAGTAIGFMYYQLMGNETESQVKSAGYENNLLVAKNNVNTEESSPIVAVENQEQEQTINKPITEFETKNELVTEQIQKPVERSSGNEIKVEKNEIELTKKETPTKKNNENNVKKEKPVEKENISQVKIPPLTKQKIIEAPLVDPGNQEKKEKVVKEEAALLQKTILPPKEKEIVETEPTYFVAVEEMPEPLGGISEIQKKIVYPELARKAGIEGKVYILAFIDETGKVTDAKIIKGIGLGCDEAALNAVLDTKFKPGKQRGKPIKVQITIPITFKI